MRCLSLALLLTAASYASALEHGSVRDGHRALAERRVHQRRQDATPSTASSNATSSSTDASGSKIGKAGATASTTSATSSTTTVVTTSSSALPSSAPSPSSPETSRQATAASTDGQLPPSSTAEQRPATVGPPAATTQLSIAEPSAVSPSSTTPASLTTTAATSSPPASVPSSNARITLSSDDQPSSVASSRITLSEVTSTVVTASSTQISSNPAVPASTSSSRASAVSSAAGVGAVPIPTLSLSTAAPSGSSSDGASAKPGSSTNTDPVVFGPALFTPESLVTALLPSSNLGLPLLSRSGQSGSASGTATAILGVVPLSVPSDVVAPPIAAGNTTSAPSGVAAVVGVPTSAIGVAASDSNRASIAPIPTLTSASASASATSKPNTLLASSRPSPTATSLATQDDEATPTSTGASVESVFGYVQTASLIVDPSTSSRPSPTATADNSDVLPSVVSTPSASPMPSSWPSKIVPPVQPPSTPPSGYAMASLLLSNSLSYNWLLQNPATASQIFVFMPALLSSALNISTADVDTVALLPYRPDGYTSSSAMLAVWVGYLPAQQISALQAQMLSPTSPLYTSGSGPAKQLALELDPSLPVDAFGSTTSAANAALATGPDTPPSDDNSRRTMLIAVVASFGAAVLALGTFVLLRTRRLRALAQDRQPGPVHLAGPDEMSERRVSIMTTSSQGSAASFRSGSSMSSGHTGPTRVLSGYEFDWAGLGHDRTSRGSSGVRRMRSGRAADISRPTLQGNSLMM